uniref:RIIa domain-containing protein n=1 Tax=Anopheles quadriannulatus TaxID=34691 RepID=A0A182XF70_ANOQN
MPISAPKIPDGLPELMRGLAKSVIKENPENLYVHAAEYFENLIRERDGHLDHGYPTFNAYQVYADYKEKTREKLGLTKDPSLSDGNGGDGDESGSGGSESKLRGRKRRRARKPTTRERDNPTTMVGNPSVSDEGEPQKLKSLSEESAPAPVVEQEIVKVHYNPPEATPSPGRVVSAQSVEAEHAVSSILDDEQILDSDGTTGGKETGDELVDNGDDIGTAPSTAEVAERPRVPTVDNLEPSGEMPLQDMETCFVHANVDDLLEKHSEDYKTEQDNELGGVPEKTKVSSVTTEGEDIPEGPQIEVQPKSVRDEGTTQHAHEVPKDDDENEIQMFGQEEQQVDSEAVSRSAAVEEAEVDSETNPIPVEGTEVQAVADFDGSEVNKDKEDKIDNESGKQDETLVTNEIKPDENNEIVEESASSPVAMDKDDDQTKANDGEDTVDVLVDETADNLTKKDEQAKFSENQTSSEAISTLPNNEQKQNTPTTPDSIEKSEEHSSAQTTEDGLKIAPRMGFEDDEPLETTDTPSKPLDLVGIDAENAIENVDSPDKVSTTNTELKTIETTANEGVLEAESSKNDEEIETAVKDAEPAEQDQSIVSEIPVKDEQDTPLTLNLSEITIEKNDLEVQPESKVLFDDDSKQGNDEQQEAEVDAKGETENKPEESNAAQSVNNDANQETKQENETHAVEAKDDALSNAEMIVTDSIEEKGNQLPDPATDPVIDQEVTGEQQATEPSIDKSDIAKPEFEEKNESANTQDNEHEQTNEETPKHEESLEEVVEEPCVKREITPFKTGPLEKEDSTEKQIEEREEIKKVDLSQLSKDSAEALFYSLKKSELENQDPADGGTMGDDHTTTATNAAIEPQKTEEDDDQDVVVKEEPVATSSEDRTKRTFTDDFLDETPITDLDATPTTTLPCDGATNALDPLSIEQERTSLEADEQKDEFNPMVMVSMRSKQFQEQLHSRDAGKQLGEGQADDATPKRPIMRRCMTEMSGLQRYDPVVDEDPSDSRPSTEDPSYVEEEDQFDGYYIGHIKNKILASSVSVADSDCPDGTRSSVESVDENQVRTALETIASTDTESTIASQATIQQAGRRSYLRKHSQNTSSNIPYASFGNAAIDQSLDEFIEREEQHKQDEAMAEAATKIQRSYRTHKKKLLRDYHSTMRTCTEDQSAESGEEYAASVIQIKLDQRRPDGPDPAEGGDAGEESDSATASHQQPLGATGRRPMYSLNIDEYDTVARRMTLTRGVAMQRNSTPEDDSGKSSNVSTDRKPSLTSSVATAKKDSAPASESGASESRSSSDEKPPKADATQGSSDEPEPKDGTLSSSRSKPKSGPAGTVTGREQHAVSAPRTATSHRTSFAPLDVQSLLLIARQRTMPVQIDSSVIRVLPKHMRKRISSAGMLDGNGKRK